MPVQPGPCCSCGSGGCSCLIDAGAGITVTGDGSAGDPFVITATGGSSGVTLNRVAALALRTAGTLSPGTSYTISDGPTIGVAGNTSATTVTVVAVSATEFGLAALVGQTFDNSAWVGEYDIDLGTGSITMLEDNLGNIVRDSLTAALVHTLFPWNFPKVRGNKVTGTNLAATIVVLTGWGLAATAGVSITDNVISGAEVLPAALGGGGVTTIVDLTGMTGATSIFTNNTVRGARLLATGTFPNGTAISNNEVRNGFRLLIAPTGAAALFILSGNTFYDHSVGSASNDMAITTNASATFLVAGSTFQGGTTTVQYAIGGNTSTIQIADSNFHGGVTVTLDPASTTDLTFTSIEVIEGDYLIEGVGGLVSLVSSTLNTLTLTRNAGATGNITVDESSVMRGTLNLAAVSTGNLIFSGSMLTGGSNVNNTLASGNVEVTNSNVAENSLVTGLVTTTRGLIVNLCNLSGGSIVQERSVDTATDSVIGAVIQSSLLTLTGLAGDTGDQSLVYRSTFVADSTVTITDPVGPTAVADTVVSGLSVLNVDTIGAVANSEVRAGSTLNTGAFAIAGVVVTGGLVKTATAANTNTYAGFGADTII